MMQRCAALQWHGSSRAIARSAARQGIGLRDDVAAAVRPHDTIDWCPGRPHPWFQREARPYERNRFYGWTSCFFGRGNQLTLLCSSPLTTTRPSDTGMPGR